MDWSEKKVIFSFNLKYFSEVSRTCWGSLLFVGVPKFKTFNESTSLIFFSLKLKWCLLSSYPLPHSRFCLFIKVYLCIILVPDGSVRHKIDSISYVHVSFLELLWIEVCLDFLSVYFTKWLILDHSIVLFWIIMFTV